MMILLVMAVYIFIAVLGASPLHCVVGVLQNGMVY